MRRRFSGAAACLSFLFTCLICSGGVQTSTIAVDPCAPPIQNPVVCENSKPGSSPVNWEVSGAGDSSIQGFATEISVNKGETVDFKVRTNSANYRADIYRLGYYAGLGARKIATIVPSVGLPQDQPPCYMDVSTGLIDCGNWAVSASWTVPEDAVSGVYIAKLVRQDASAGSSHIVFIIRDDAGASDLLFQTSDTTWHAYNSYGGNSLYAGNPAGRAYKVSYNRPFNTRVTSEASFLFSAEYPMIRFLEANGYNVSYFTGVDTDRRGALIGLHKVFLSVGHDEYWSADQRLNVEAARNAGIHLAFFSGNEVFWKTRWEPSIDGSNTPHRTLVCYKETHANRRLDPTSIWTGTWRDTRFPIPGDPIRPENSLTGTLFMVNGPRADLITVPASFGNMRFWRNTSIAVLPPEETAFLARGSLGYEWDEIIDNDLLPAGLLNLSSTTVNVSTYLQDYGSTYGSGTATHHLTLYRHDSGALVFSAGTVQWAWGVDPSHPNTVPADPRMQQATVNLLADMGVQPATLSPGLIAAAGPTDVVAPVSSISWPPVGDVLRLGPTMTITGTAEDFGGGSVAAVDVSTDGGLSWHRATGTANWSYAWSPRTAGPVNIQTRAVDDSANVEARSVGIDVLLQGQNLSLWNLNISPFVPFRSDPAPVEVGVKFYSDVDGWIHSIQFYKDGQNLGLHTVSLYTHDGTLLARVPSARVESPSGWQTIYLPTPVPITANTIYVASYHTTLGYSTSRFYFAQQFDNGPLHSPADSNFGNGVYRYGSTPGFPNNSSGGTNYWVDVNFVPIVDVPQ